MLKAEERENFSSNYLITPTRCEIYSGRAERNQTLAEIHFFACQNTQQSTVYSSTLYI